MHHGDLAMVFQIDAGDEYSRNADAVLIPVGLFPARCSSGEARNFARSGRRPRWWWQGT